MADGVVVRISLSQGLFATIDASDLERVSQHKWSAVVKTHTTYAQAATPDKRRQLALHRFILDAPAGMMVDHINGDGLDNRRCNIRLATANQNNWNQRVHKTERKVSRFKGVTWKSRGKPWGAAIQQNGERLFIGSYRTEVEAARAYDATAKVVHGRFACTNASMGLFDEHIAA